MPVLHLSGLLLALHPSVHVPLRPQLRGAASASMVAIDVTQLDLGGPPPEDDAHLLAHDHLLARDVATHDGAGGHGGRDGFGHDGGRGDDEGGGDGGSAAWLAAPWAAYTAALDESPLLVKSLTAGLVGGLGDTIAQRFGRSADEPFDHQRNLGVWLDGVLVSGPGLHLGYSMLERRIPCANRGSLRNALAQVAIDELIFDPVFIATFFFTTGFVERQHPWHETLPNLRRQYWPTLRGAFLTSALFSPIQYVSFRYLPVRTRVLVVNTCDVLWYAAVSLGRHVEHGPEAHRTADASA